MLNPYRGRLLASTLLVSASLVASPALAQDAATAARTPSGAATTPAGTQSQESAPPAEPTSSGDIVVTGSLISNPNLVASSPVAVIGQEEIQLRQSNTAEEILRDLPGAVPSVGSAVNNGNGGNSFVNLRGLGSTRNVVLIDGSRLVPAELAGRFDLNNVPLALIERVDTLTGGAATTYGADAVAGVVNFITRSDFSGLEAQVSNQLTEDGDGNYIRADVTVGANFDDGKGNAVFSIGYQQSDPVYQGERQGSILNRSSYDPNNLALAGSGTAVPSTFSGTRPINPATGLPSTVASVLNGGNRQLNTTTGQAVAAYAPFNFNPYNIFQTPFERFNMYGAGHYEVADGIEIYTRGLFSKNTVNTIIAPSGAFATSVTIPLSNPYLPAALRNQFCAFNVAPVVAGVPSGYTPRFTTAQCNAAALATSPTDPNFRTVTVNLSRRTTEVGPRLGNFQTTTFDYKLGTRIGITNSLNLDVSGAYGESENVATQRGYTLNTRFRSALYATNTTTCLGGAPNGSTTAGCVPVNVFGPAGSITPAQAAYLTADSSTTVRTSLAQARALLNGDFGFASPFANDAIGFAAGTEYRKYRAQQRADSLAQAGDLGGAGAAAPNIDGGYEVYEGYGELIAPLVQDKPFFQSLTLEAGIRYSHYKVFAPSAPTYNTTTYKAGGSWEPVDGIKIRGDYQRAVRAPNISELFSPVNTGLTSLATDPCAGTAPITNANLRAVCLAQGAPAGTIGSITNPTAAQANVTSGGNINLRPEKSDSYTIGVVLQPKAYVPGLSITADYYRIKVKGAVSAFTPGDILDQCFGNLTADSATSSACQSIQRNPVTGGLDGDPATTKGLLSAISNLGTIETDGIDAGFNYRRDLGFAKLNLSAQGNYTFNSYFQGAPGLVNRDCTGFYSVANCGNLQPKFYWNVRSTFTLGSVDLSLLWRHISKFRQEPADADIANGGTPFFVGLVDGKQTDLGRINAYNYFDLTARLGVSENFDLTVAVTNLLDKSPPLTGANAGSTAYNSGNTFPSTYDALGRRYAVGARLKF